MPAGLAVDASTGMLSGKASKDAEEREYRATVTVVDKNKIRATGTVKLKLVGGLPEDFAIGDCNSNTVCSLGSTPVAIPDFTNGRWMENHPMPKSCFSLDTVHEDMFE